MSRTLRAITAAVALLLCMAVAVPVDATTEATAPSARAEQHCVILLDRLHPGEETSRVLKKTCADRPDAPALRAASGLGTLLIIVYQDIRYGGASTAIEGRYGPCDQEGYGIRDLGSWRNRLSSFKAFNWCNFVAAWDNINYGGAYLGDWHSAASDSRLNVDWVGSNANDRIESMQLVRQ